MNRYSVFLLLLISLIFCLGLIMIFNTTSAEALNQRDLEITRPFLKQIIFAVLGTCIALLTCRIGYAAFLKKSPQILFCLSILLILVFVPGIGSQINGAHRWIGYKIFSFQPSEFAKIFIPLFAIEMIVRKKTALTPKFFYALSFLILVPIFFILIQPDNGMAAILMMTLVVLFFLAKIRFLYWALPIFIFLLIGGAAASQMKHVSDRIRIYIHPELDLLGKGHQPYQAKIAAGSGKLLGRGLGESLQKLSYLPKAHNDYIAAIYAEEFGFLGITFVIFIYMTFAFLGFRIAVNATNIKGYYAASILTFLICFQAFLNLGIVCGILPSKGTNLPFFSQGGSSLLSSFFAAALLLSISEEKKYEHA